MKRSLSSLLFLIVVTSSLAQVAINPSGAAPAPSSGLDVNFNDRGFLPPRLSSAERDAIIAPAEGLTIFNTTTKCTNVFNGSAWYEICGNCIVPVPGMPSEITGDDTPCAGESNVEYSVTNVPGTTYTWTFPGDWVQTSGGTTSQVSVTIGNSGGDITVTPSNMCGTGPGRTLTVPSGVLEIPVALAASDAISIAFTANWGSATGAVSYRLDVSTDPDFNSFVSGYEDADVGSSTSLSISGLTPVSTYYYRVRSVNACGTSASSDVISVNTTAVSAYEFTEVGTTTWTAPNGLTQVEVLVVAGGGGGGFSRGGGGGGGGVIYQAAYPVTGGQTYSITVGAGGNGAVDTNGGLGELPGGNGGNSVFATITALGGGGAGSNAAPPGISGGSGGGGGGNGHGPGGSGSPGQGFNGGNGQDGSASAGGGGGGAGGNGGGGSAGNSGGNGGPGAFYSISGSSLAYGGGGGGGIENSGEGGTGGSGVGGNGSRTSAGFNGMTNRGGGGGGGGNSLNGGAGGSGIVILRY